MMCLCFSNVFRFSTETSVHILCVCAPVEELASGECDVRISGALLALPAAESIHQHNPFGRKWSSHSASQALFWGGGPRQGNGHMQGHMWVGPQLAFHPQQSFGTVEFG